MNEWLIAFGRWLQNTSWGLALGSSDWAYPYIQLTHFTGLSLWVGTSVAIDLKLLGVGKRGQTAAQTLDTLFFWNWTGLAIAVTGGFMLFSTAAEAFVTNPAFRVKLGILIPVALVWHIIVQRKTRKWSESAEIPAVAKFAGLAEILLWVSVVTAASSIPYF